MRIRSGVVSLNRIGLLYPLFVIIPLLSCSAVITASRDNTCYATGYAIGKGIAKVTCTPSSKTIIINPPGPPESIDTPDLVWMEPEQLAPLEPVVTDDIVLKGLIDNICLVQGCTIIETSETGVEIKGGPPDANLLSGFFEGLFSAASWLASRYFGAGF
jgi:hypothetical protein